MRAIAAVVILGAACASQSGFNDARYLDCDAGQGVSIAGDLRLPSVQMSRTEDLLTVQVEVANNSHEEIVVRSIRTEQVSASTAPYQVDGGSRRFNQTIPEGDEHLFELPVTGRAVLDPLSRHGGSRGEIVMSVLVDLSNGDVYRCRFAVPAPL